MKAPNEIKAANWKRLFKILKKIKKKYKVQVVSISYPEYNGHFTEGIPVKPRTPTVTIEFMPRLPKDPKKKVKEEIKSMTVQELADLLNE